MRSKLFILGLLLGMLPNLFGQLNSGVHVKRGDTLFIGTFNHLASPSKDLKLSRKEALYLDLIDICHVRVGFDKSRNFRVVDSIYGFYSPSLSVDDFSGMQIIRTFSENSDTSYILGMNIYPKIPLKRSLPLNREIIANNDNAKSLMNGNDRFYLPNTCSYLNKRQLKKLNATGGFGIMYNIEISKPFKGRFHKCKAIAFENLPYNYATLYYFYNDTSDKRITNKIISQLGIVKFDDK